MLFHSKIIRDIAEEMRPQVYVGLGICGGYTFQAVLPHAVEAYACDIDPNCINSVQNPKTRFYGMPTDEFAGVWKNEIKKQINLIFIDAGHSKENVFEDATNFYPYLKEDTGLMILHDTWPPDRETYTKPEYCGDGYLAKDKLLARLPNVEMATIPCQYGLTLIRKRGGNWRNG